MSNDFRVYWSMLQDRAMYDKAAMSLARLALHNGYLGYGLIAPPYLRTDIARNVIARQFLAETENPDSILIMLDADHAHPFDVCERLVSTMLQFDLPGERMGVLGALYFRRAAPFDPLFFKRAPGEEDERLYMRPGDYEPDVIYSCDHVGTGAIAIRRWVFTELSDVAPLWFRYAYHEIDIAEEQPGEDTYFARQCERHGVKHWVHTGIVTDHLRVDIVNRDTWQKFKQNGGKEIYEKAVQIETQSKA